MTRGIRNNNPLNIRISNSEWEGKTPPNPLGKGEKDPEFEQFVSMEYGFRAAILTIETYIIKHACNTIRTIINRWAPASDGNNTENYIRYVCSKTGVGGNETISNHDKRLKDIVWAMAQMECGQEIMEYKSSLEHAFDNFEPREVFYDKTKKQYVTPPTPSVRGLMTPPTPSVRGLMTPPTPSVRGLIKKHNWLGKPRNN